MAHFDVMDRLKPAVYCNIHNWTSKFRDGLIGWDQEEVDTFETFMPHQDGMAVAMPVIELRLLLLF